MFRRLTSVWAVRSLLASLALVVCVSPVGSQKLAQPVATVIDCIGQVSVLDGGDGGMQIPLSVGRTVRQAQVIATGPDGWARFQYTDGSTFEIFPKSRVIFQEHPADWQHLLNVWIGHVKVWIQHAPGVPNFKNVSTPTAVISVRGTVFSVDVEDEDTTKVSVEDGIVDVRNTTAITGNVPRLTAGQSIVVIRNVPLAFKGGHQNVIIAKGIRAIEDTMYQIILRRGVGGIAGGGPAGAPGQGDRGKKVPGGTTTGTGTPTPPTAPTVPTPPAAPTPPGGGGGE